MKKALVILLLLLVATVGRAVTWFDFTDCIYVLGDNVPEGISLEGDSLLRGVEIFYIGAPTVYPDSQGGPFLWSVRGRKVGGVYVIDNLTPRTIKFYIKIGEEDFSEPVTMYIDGWDAKRRILTAKTPEGAVTQFNMLSDGTDGAELSD